ncbi:MAG: BON domain-containing protein, partial [Pseudomonadota bacterium]
MLTVFWRSLACSSEASIAAGLALALCSAGCVPVVVGAGAATGIAVAQERSFGTAVDDTTIDMNVGALLLKENDRLFSNVGVEVQEGRVLLTGGVPTPEDRLKATMIAWRSPGVKEVINELQISDKSSLGSIAKDSWITTKLRTRILADRRVLDINYSIETVNGVIYLIGVAGSQEELNIVTDYARNISGVERVVSHVRVKANRSHLRLPPQERTPVMTFRGICCRPG